MFYVELIIGMPLHKLNMTLDTASIPSWVLTSTCSKCFVASTLDFEAENSPTFLLKPSNPTLCGGMLLQLEGSNCTYQYKFMYSHAIGDQGFLALGEDAILIGLEIHTTPIYGLSDEFYCLWLYGSSVNRERLAIDLDVFL